MLNIKQDPYDGLVIFLDHLEATEKHIQIAANRTIRKTVRWLKTAISRQVARDRKLNVGTIKEALKINASTASLSQRLYLSKHSRVIKAYKAGKARQTKKGVRIRNHFFDNAFIATMKSTGHTGIFRRKGKERLPLQEMYIVIAPSIQQAMEEYVGDKGRAYMERTFNHELKYVMARS